MYNGRLGATGFFKNVDFKSLITLVTGRFIIPYRSV